MVLVPRNSLTTVPATGLRAGSRRLDEAEVGAQQKQDEMHDGAVAAHFEDRHRDIGKIEIEQDAGVDEEGAGQEFAEVPVVPREIQGSGSGEDAGGRVSHKDHRCSSDRPPACANVLAI
jgi:hypothetical protein